jgi:hypothetical protein
MLFHRLVAVPVLGCGIAIAGPVFGWRLRHQG